MYVVLRYFDFNFLGEIWDKIKFYVCMYLWIIGRKLLEQPKDLYFSQCIKKQSTPSRLFLDNHRIKHCLQV